MDKRPKEAGDCVYFNEGQVDRERLIRALQNAAEGLMAPGAAYQIREARPAASKTFHNGFNRGLAWYWREGGFEPLSDDLRKHVVIVGTYEVPAGRATIREWLEKR